MSSEINLDCQLLNLMTTGLKVTKIKKIVRGGEGGRNDMRERDEAGNTNLRGKLCTNDLLIKVACFVRYYIFNVKSS